MFDVTRASTFEAVQKWKNDLDNKVILPNGSPVPVILLANKVLRIIIINNLSLLSTTKQHGNYNVVPIINFNPRILIKYF